MKRSSTPFSVNIAMLKSQLAKYLRMVRTGNEVIVTDHRQPVARLVPYETTGKLETLKPKAPFSQISSIDVPPLKEMKGSIDSLSLLLDERGKR